MILRILIALAIITAWPASDTEAWLAGGSSILASGPLGSGGLVSHNIAASGAAYSATSINMWAVGGGRMATSGHTQYLCYFDTALHLRFLSRDITTNAVTTYADAGLPLPLNDDAHRVCTIAIDNNGFIHLSYGNHDDQLIYFRSNAANNPTAFTARTMLGGSPEASATYPFFMKNPSNGALYFTFRSGASGNGDQYFYQYDTGTALWAAATGSSTAGLIIHDIPTGNPYQNAIPKWDASGKLWFNWQKYDGSTAFNEYLMAWNGTGFQDDAGTALTMPVVSANFTPAVVVAPNTGLIDQNYFTIQNGVFYIGYSHQDAGGIWQVYVAESSTGAFVEHKLTSFLANPPAGCAPTGTSQCTVQGIWVVGDGATGTVYVVYSDIWTAAPGPGVVAIKSTNNFSTFSTQVLFSTYTPNFAMVPDPSRVATTISFLRMDADDPQFNYYSGSTPPYTFANAGSMVVYDWSITYTPGTPPNLGGTGYCAQTASAPAVAAGFTTQVMCADFTSTSNNYVVNGVTSSVSWSPLSNWLADCGGPSPALRFAWTNYGAGSGPCGQIDIETDNTISPAKQVLHLNANDATIRSLSWPSFPFSAPGTGYMPIEYYTELTWRVAQGGLLGNQAGSLIAGGFMATSPPASSNWWEPDNLEVQSNPSATSSWVYGDGSIEWCGGVMCSPICCLSSDGAATDVRAYHTYGTLFTSDGSIVYKCPFQDGTRTGTGLCSNHSFVNPSDANTRSNVMLWGVGSFGGPVSVPVDVYIQSISIWQCAAWNTSTCPGTLVTTWP